MADEVVVKGIPEFDKALGEMVAKVDAAGYKFVYQGGLVIAGHAKSQFIGGNEAAATDTWRSDAWPVPTRRSGQLQQSIKTSTPTGGNGVWTSLTGPRTVYGRRVELGYTGTGVWPYFTTRPFPFLKPGLEDSMPELDRLFTETVLAAQEA